MPEVSGLSEWVADVGRGLEDKSAIADTQESRIIQKVAERVGIDTQTYYDLMDGEPGEVPGEFDTAAEQILGEEDLKVQKVLGFVRDRQVLRQALAELEDEVSPEDTHAFQTIRTKLIARAESAAGSVVEVAKESESARRALSDEALAGIDTVLADTPLEVGRKINVTSIAESAYYKNLGGLLGEEPRRQIWDNIKANRYEVHSREQYRSWIALCSTVARDKLGRFARGEVSYVRAPGNYESVFSGGHEQGAVFTELSQRLVNGLAEDLDNSFEQSTSHYDRADEVDLTLSSVTDGLILGAMGSDRLINAPGDIKEITDQMGHSAGAGRVQDRYTSNRMEHTETHRDAVAIGYILGLLDRGDSAETEVIASMRVALRAIRDEGLRSQIELLVRDNASQMDPDIGIGVALLLNDRDFAGTYDRGQEIFDQRLPELQESETRAQRDGVRESMYETFYGSLVREYQELRFGLWDVRRLEDVSQHRNRLEIGIAQREASFRILSEMLRMDAQVARDTGRSLSWDDAEHVMNLVVQNGGLHDEYRLNSLLGDGQHSQPSPELDQDQQRMVAMLRVAVLSTTNGRAYDKAREISRLCERGLISAQDVLTAHNAVVVAVDGVNRALMQENPDLTPPLGIHSLIETLSELRQESRGGWYSSPSDLPRVGPFAKARLYTGLQITYGDRSVSKVPYYFVRDDSANRNPVHTYHLDYNERERPAQARKTVQEEVHQQLEAVTAYTEIIAARKFGAASFEKATRINSRDAQDTERWLDRNFNGNVVEAARLYGWEESARTVQDEARKIQQLITNDSGEFAAAQRSFGRVYTECGGLIRTLNEMDTSPQQRRGLLDFGGKREDTRLANQERDQIIAKLEELGVQQESLTSLRGADIRDQGARDQLRQVAIDTANDSATRLLDQISIVNSQLDGIPDITQEVISRRVSEDGVVELPRVLTPDGLRPSLEAKSVSVGLLGDRSDYIGQTGIGSLLMEADLTLMAGKPLREAGGILDDIATPPSGIYSADKPRSLPRSKWSTIIFPQTGEKGEVADTYERVRIAIDQLTHRLTEVDLSVSRTAVAEALSKAWITRSGQVRQDADSVMDRIASRVPSKVYSQMSSAIES